ncbi:MAG: transglycosylase SLT domain-containing protein [Rhodobacteraceae bacterium]|nr:transglycosylase SLT domain-containing protein [Paracoccaceae bacterium]
MSTSPPRPPVPPPPGRARGLAALVLARALAALPAAARATGRAAAADPARLCEAAARSAAVAAGVPADLLLAVALAESGRRRDGRLRPWPWTVNDGTAGHWFATRAEAEAFAADLARAGRESYDVGCFQINRRWHGAAFASPAAMFDPEGGARHAADFLARLARRLGSWEAAAGAYHSRTPARAEAYGARVATLRGTLAAGPAAPAARPRPRPAPAPAPPQGPARPAAGSLFIAAGPGRPLVRGAAGPLLRGKS